MRKIVIAPNAFKECLTPSEVAQAIKIGVLKALPDAQIVTVPLADGGDGTTEALIEVTDGTRVQAQAANPLGRQVIGHYGLISNGEKAVFEMAEVSGLRLLAPPERNPMITSTRGTGELLIDAISRGAKEILIGIGGSATVDGGTGMARALGYEFLDINGTPLPEGGGSLEHLARIDTSNVKQEVFTAQITVACDVGNPLTGDRGAARIFGPQKGATPEMVETLERGLVRLAEVIQEQFGITVAEIPGAGAAGGLGAGLMVFAKASLESGARLVARFANLEEVLEGSDLVITGEGRLDAQTAMGKLPSVVAEYAAKQGVKVVGLAGSLGEGWEALNDAGMTAVFAIQQGPTSVEDSIARAKILLASAAEQVCRLCFSGQIL